jgi:hypothetical protein
MNLPSPLTDDTNSDAATQVGDDLQRSLARSMDYVVREWRNALADVETRQQGYVPAGERDDLASLREFTRDAIDAFEGVMRSGPARLDYLTPDDLDWHHLTDEWRRDEAAGRALWGTVGTFAREELNSGRRGAAVVERLQSRPIDRARYLAVREALADGLQPRNGMEWVLIDGMTDAWTLFLHWTGKHVLTEGLDAQGLRRTTERYGEWEPPRLREAEAVDRAALMADRFQRQFLRLMRCYRDGRKLIGSMTVLGGQVNVAERQIVASQADAQDSNK